MKNTFKIAAVALLILCPFAEANAVDFGIKGGVVVSKLPQKNSDVKFFDNTVGFIAGGSALFDLPLGFALEPSLQYHVKGATLKEVKETYKFGYLELPVMVQWGLSFADNKARAFLQAGPYVGYALGKNQSDVSWNDINRFEGGAAVGLGASVFGFQLSVLYDWNLGRLAKDKQISEYLSELTKDNFAGWNFTLTYWF